MTFEEKIRIALIYSDKEIDSITDLEAKMGVGQGAISKYIRENKEPPIGMAKKIVRFLGVRPEWWVSQQGNVLDEKGTFVKKNSPSTEVIP